MAALLHTPEPEPEKLPPPQEEKSQEQQQNSLSFASTTVASAPAHRFEFSRPADWRTVESKNSVTLYAPFATGQRSRIVVAPYYGYLEAYCMKEISAEAFDVPKINWEVRTFVADEDCPGIYVDGDSRSIYVLYKQPFEGREGWMILAHYQQEEEDSFLRALQEVVNTFSAF